MTRKGRVSDNSRKPHLAKKAARSVFGSRRGVRANEVDSAERKAPKEDARPPFFIECLVKSVLYLSFSGNNVDLRSHFCDIPPTSEIHPSVGGTERRAGSFVVEGVSGFVSVRAMARARVAMTTVMCVRLALRSSLLQP